jgi:hypothetical protein
LVRLARAQTVLVTATSSRRKSIMKLPYVVLAAAVLAAGLLGGCTAGESESPCTATTSCAGESADPSDGTTGSGSPELLPAGQATMLTDIIEQASFTKYVSSSSWNDDVIQVGAWADTTTQNDRLTLCNAIVAAVRPTGQVKRVTVTAFQTSPSAAPQATAGGTANPLVIWLSPEANCKVDA